MKISVIIICSICSVVSFFESVNGVCNPHPDLVEPGMICRKSCVSDSDCKGPLKNCYCDGNCGMSCFNKDANCSVPQSSPNGGVEYTSIKYGSIAKHFCNDGFVLINHITNKYNRKCRSDKKWSGIPIECKKGCLKPGNVGKNGIAKDDSQQLVGAEVEYDCGFGYYVYNGPAIRKCLNDSTWSVATFSCQLKSCSRPKKPDNGYVNYTSTTFSSRIQFGCNEGYTLSGMSDTPTIACSVSFETNEPYWRFQGAEPACTIVRCGAPPGLLNGTLIDNKVDYVFGQSISYKCNDGFDISKPASKRYYCRANGTWDTPPTCKKTYNCSFAKFESKFCGYTSRNWARIFSLDTYTGKDTGKDDYVVRALLSASLTSATFAPNNKTVSISFWYKLPDESELSLKLKKANGRSNVLWSTQYKTDWKHITAYFYPQPTAVSWEFLLTSQSATYTLLDEIVVTQTDKVPPSTTTSFIDSAQPTTSMSMVNTKKDNVSPTTSMSVNTIKESTSIIMSTPHGTSIPKQTILIARGKLATPNTATKATLTTLPVTQSIIEKHKCQSTYLCWIVAAAIFVMFCLVVICCQLQKIQKCLVASCCCPFGSPTDKHPKSAEDIPLNSKPVVNV